MDADGEDAFTCYPKGTANGHCTKDKCTGESWLDCSRSLALGGHMDLVVSAVFGIRVQYTKLWSLRRHIKL